MECPEFDIHSSQTEITELGSSYDRAIVYGIRCSAIELAWTLTAPPPAEQADSVIATKRLLVTERCA
jgi:hypothetical protein